MIYSLKVWVKNIYIHKFSNNANLNKKGKILIWNKPFLQQKCNYCVLQILSATILAEWEITKKTKTKTNSKILKYRNLMCSTIVYGAMEYLLFYYYFYR